MTTIAINLAGWGNIAQLVVAGAAILALVGAAAQIHVTRSIARRSLAYEYAARFNEPSMVARIAEYQKYWDGHTYAEWWSAAYQHDSAAQTLLIVPNLIEELAAAYNRKLLDRNVATMYLGVTVEVLWKQSESLVVGARNRRDKWVYSEWEDMLLDSKQRRLGARRKVERRRARRKLIWGE